MTRAALFAGFALVAAALPALAQDEPRPSLAEVMQGATGMAALGSGYPVARPGLALRPLSPTVTVG